MYTSHLREIDNAIMVEIPKELLEELQLKPGSVVALEADGSKVVVSKTRESKYTLDELLSQCDFSIPMTQEEREWLDAPAVGRELI